MNNTTDKNSLFSETDNISAMDLGNSFDYVHDYYINSYDYTLDSIDSLVDDTTSTKGCTVVSEGDSINIIHENGTDKHVQKKKYESASKKYNEKKREKEKAKAIAKAQSKSKSSSTSRSTNHAYKNHFNTSNTSKTSNNSHNEVFGTSTTTKRTSTSAIKLIIFLFVILPYVAAIFFSCVGEFLDAL